MTFDVDDGTVESDHITVSVVQPLMELDVSHDEEAVLELEEATELVDSGNYTLLGTVKVPIRVLHDQTKHSDWFDLHAPNSDRVIGGRVRLGLMWLYNLTKVASATLNDS